MYTQIVMLLAALRSMWCLPTIRASGCAAAAAPSPARPHRQAPCWDATGRLLQLSMCRHQAGNHGTNSAKDINVLYAKCLAGFVMLHLTKASRGCHQPLTRWNRHCLHNAHNVHYLDRCAYLSRKVPAPRSATHGPSFKFRTCSADTAVAPSPLQRLPLPILADVSNTDVLAAALTTILILAAVSNTDVLAVGPHLYLYNLLLVIQTCSLQGLPVDGAVPQGAAPQAS